MRLIRLSSELITAALGSREPFPSPAFDQSAVSVGSFDGFHLGHAELVGALRAARDRLSLKRACLFTFRYHPRLVLNKGAPPRLLTDWSEKLSLLQDAGVEAVVAADFCPALASQTYDSFVKRFLCGFLGMRHLVGGYDIHLGRGREGTAEKLADLAQASGFGFETVPALRLPDGQIISSSAIRRSLDAGEVRSAAAMLGRPYALRGEVGYGDGLGSRMGYATANVKPLYPDKLLPAPGVYAVRVHLPLDAVRGNDSAGVVSTRTGALPEVDRHGELLGTVPSEWAVFNGMLNFGRAPTVHGDGLLQPRIEVHIFDFTGYIRERSIMIEWMARLRDEQTFASVDELRENLARDEERTRAILAADT